MIIKPRYNGPQMPTTYAVTMTAAASGSSGITVSSDADINPGSGPFFIHLDLVPSGYVGSSGARHNSINNSAGSSVNIPLVFFALSGGNVTPNLFINTVGYPATTTVSSATFLSSNKWTMVVNPQSPSTDGSVVYYRNGTQFGASVAIPAGAPHTFTGSNLIIEGTSASREPGNTISCIVGNFAPTAAEVATLCTTGIPESWKWGSQAAVYAQDTSAGADSWTGTSVTVAGNVDGIGGRDNVLSATCTTTGTSDTPRITRASVIPSAGKKASITFNLYRPAANTAVVGFRVTDSAGAGIFSGSVNNIITTAADTWQSFTISGTVVSTATTTIRLYPINAAGVRQQVTGEVLYLDATTSTQHGVTMALLPSSIPTSGATAWDDSSGNTGGGTLPAAGATKVTIRK